MKYVFSIVVAWLFCSCWSVNHKNFTLPLNKYVKDNSLKKNGYFIHHDPKNRFRIFLFYDNGVAYFVDYGMNNDFKGGIDSFIGKRILANLPPIADAKIPGSFGINENKIEINIISHTNYAWHKVEEFQGTILTDTSFMIISDYLPGVYKLKDTVIYHFVPSIKPDSTNWLMKRKWYKGK
jgi:hypothetical protein